MSKSGMSDVESRTGYRFRDRTLLKLALTHGSYAESIFGNNQRLEFLGDRVLALCVAEELNTKYPQEAVGDIAQRFNHIVSRKSCAEVAMTIELDRAIIMNSEARRIGSHRKTSVLAGVIEALIAAIFLDSDWITIKEIVLKLWVDKFDFRLEEAKNSKGRLQEYLLGKGQSLPVYRVLDRIGPDHGPLFTVIVESDKGESATASATSIQEAEKQAAVMLYELLSHQSG